MTSELFYTADPGMLGRLMTASMRAAAFARRRNQRVLALSEPNVNFTSLRLDAILGEEAPICASRQGGASVLRG